ncbi:hypothetical protein J2T13_001553 [Paenibacillus sp. DS2015]|uniref:EcsC family protein n=1 Tax=Paenibacillus sp. DS2015 TaxID=3373917 RepID=UPI003D240248
MAYMENQIETQEQLQEQLNQINKWEKTQKKVWIWEKIGRIPFMLLDKLTPKVVREKLGVALNEIGGFIQTGGQYLVQEKSMLKRLVKADQLRKAKSFQDVSVAEDSRKGVKGDEQDQPSSIANVSLLPLCTMDEVADELIASRVKFAAAQGATTGIGGIFTVAIDIPVVLGTSLKVLQELAICYGYDPKEKQERIFIVKCLQFSSADVVGRKAILEELTAHFDQKNHDAQVFSQLQGWREVVQTYVDSFGWKKLLQLVPIAGIVFGSMSNKGMMEGVGEAGKMLYRKRRIVQRLEEMKAHNANTPLG